MTRKSQQPPKPKPVLSPRRSAVYLLDKVLGDRRLLAELQAAGALDRLPPADRARAQRLATDTLRSLERADRLISRHLRKKPPLHVRNILRLATVEMANGGDAHGIVHEAVQMVGANRHVAHLKGLTNAVLRKLSQEAPRVWSDLRQPRLPDWLRRPLVSAYGPGAVTRFEAAHVKGAPIDLTARSDAAAVAEATGGTLLTTGSVRLYDAGQVSAMPGFDSGDWWVQDAAAALPARILNAGPNEMVLDLCAAPGGKTMQLSASGAQVTALDVSEKRMKTVADNLSRTGLSAELVTGDVLEYAGGPFDAILLDAPCSATGTIRRHPDLPHAKDGADFMELFALQEAMIDHAWTLLRPGGRLVFCTCSLLPDEGECQIEEALTRLTDARIDRDALGVPGIDPAWITDEGGLRLRPDYMADQGGMDGFYIACLRKAG